MSIKTAVSQIRKKYGEDAIFTIGDSKDAVIERFTSGVPEIDAIIGGGIPRGRIIEVFGPNQAGKTSLSFAMSAGLKHVAYLDLEHTFEGSRAKVFGCKRGQLLVSRPTFGEHAFEQMYRYASVGIDLIIVDSVPALIPRAVWEQKDLEKNPGVALIPRLMSVRLPELVHLAHESGTTVVFINQIRDKIGIAFPGGNNSDTPGGHAFKHFSSLRIQLQRRGFIEGPKRQKLGYVMKTRIIKSKVSEPWGEAETPFIFNEGFVTNERVTEIRRELGARK